MAEQRWEKLGAATGIAFVVLAITSYVVAGEAPLPADSTEEVVAYYTDNRDSVLLAAYLWGLAGIAYLWFLGSLRAHLRRAEGEPGRLSAVAFGAGIASGAVYSVGVSISSVLGYSIAQNSSPEVTGAFSDLTTHLFNGTGFGFFVLVLATTLVGGRTKALPAWLGWFGWLVALLILAGTLSVVVDSGPLAIGEIVSILGFFGFFLWFLALAITVTMQVGKDSAVQR